MSLNFLSDNDVRILKDLVSWKNRQTENSAVNRSNSDSINDSTSEVYIARVPTIGIPALTSIGTTPSPGDIPGTSTCEIYRIYDVGSGDPIIERDSSSDQLVYNYSTSRISGDSEWISIIKTKNGRWVALTTSPSTLGPSLSSGICSCSCIDEGDIVVGGYETTSRLSVVLPELINQEVKGKVYLPAGEYILDYSSSLGYWLVDISSDLLAFYNNGSPYTIPTTGSGILASGSIKYRHSDGTGYQTLEINWTDNLIP